MRHCITYIVKQLIVVYLPDVTWKNTRMKTIMIIYSQILMGMDGADDICDYAAI